MIMSFEEKELGCVCGGYVYMTSRPRDGWAAPEARPPRCLSRRHGLHSELAALLLLVCVAVDV